MPIAVVRPRHPRALPAIVMALLATVLLWAGPAAAQFVCAGSAPSAVGKTTVAVNPGFYRGEAGVGIGVAHRLNYAAPTVVYGSYSSGGAVEHVGRAGFAVEF